MCFFNLGNSGKLGCWQTSRIKCFENYLGKTNGGIYKLNVDAAFMITERSGAAGAVLRDNQGVYVNVPSAVVAQALAMLHGLQLANNLGYSRIQAESDNWEVIQLCRGEERIWNEATTVYADIVSTAGSIGNVSFTHCK